MRANAGMGTAFAMTSAQVLIVVRMRLGLPLPLAGLSGQERCNCSCRVRIDKLGYHLTVCKQAGKATQLHNKVNWGVVRMHEEAGRYGSLEPRGLFPGDNPQPDGIVYAGKKTRQ